MVADRPPECVAPGCDRRVHGQGLCSSHYNLAWRAGVLRPKKPRGAAEARFARRLRPEGGCLVFLTAQSTAHPRFWDGTRMSYARSFAWELVHGPVPPLGILRQTCATPGCVEVGHLRLEPWRGPGPGSPPLPASRLALDDDAA